MCRGIAVGGCVFGGELGQAVTLGAKRLHIVAHAHNFPAYPEQFGVICVLDPFYLHARGGESPNPSRYMWHEYAHLLAPGRGHDERWRRAMHRLGQPIPARYGPRTRRE